MADVAVTIVVPVSRLTTKIGFLPWLESILAMVGWATLQTTLVDALDGPPTVAVNRADRPSVTIVSAAMSATLYTVSRTITFSGRNQLFGRCFDLGSAGANRNEADGLAVGNDCQNLGIPAAPRDRRVEFDAKRTARTSRDIQGRITPLYGDGVE